MNLVGDHVDSGTLELLLDSVSEQSITGCVSDVHDTFFRVGRGLDNGDGLVGGDGVDISPVLRREVG